MNRTELQENIGMVPNGLVQDIDRVTRKDYANKLNPIMFDNHGEYSLKGIIEQTPISSIFFSAMNVNGIQSTIRYRIFKKNNVTISQQSENELFIVMRSIYLQFGNSFVLSDDIVSEIRKLNEKVIEYCFNNVEEQLKQYQGYKQKISNLPIPLEHPIYDNKNNFTYDSSNLL
tara:strand:- start:11 stop:529 length:519 start_codon:yes stop_codon:yes gene_type:complete